MTGGQARRGGAALGRGFAGREGFGVLGTNPLLPVVCLVPARIPLLAVTPCRLRVRLKAGWPAMGYVDGGQVESERREGDAHQEEAQGLFGGVAAQARLHAAAAVLEGGVIVIPQEPCDDYWKIAMKDESEVVGEHHELFGTEQASPCVRKADRRSARVAARWRPLAARIPRPAEVSRRRANGNRGVADPLADFVGTLICVDREILLRVDIIKYRPGLISEAVMELVNRLEEKP